MSDQVGNKRVGFLMMGLNNSRSIDSMHVLKMLYRISKILAMEIAFCDQFVNQTATV